MKKLVLGLSLVLTATAANAMSDNAKYVAVDSSLESSLCVVAATKGFDTAYQQALSVSKAYAKSLYLNSCNGVAIKEFALPLNSVSDETNEGTKAKLIKVVAADQTPESKLCAKAAKEGYYSLVKLGKRDYSLEAIVCNGKKIKAFAKENASI